MLHHQVMFLRLHLIHIDSDHSIAYLDTRSVKAKGAIEPRTPRVMEEEAKTRMVRL